MLSKLVTALLDLVVNELKELLEGCTKVVYAKYTTIKNSNIDLCLSLSLFINRALKTLIICSLSGLTLFLQNYP